MSGPTYLPTRHEFLAVAAFHRRIHAHRQQYVHVDLDQPTEIYTSKSQLQAKADRFLLSVVKYDERVAEFTLLRVKMGHVLAKAACGKMEWLNRGWINASKWEVSVTQKIGEMLGYCAVHDAFFEITVMINMEWFGEGPGAS